MIIIIENKIVKEHSLMGIKLHIKKVKHYDNI